MEGEKDGVSRFSTGSRLCPRFTLTVKPNLTISESAKRRKVSSELSGVSWKRLPAPPPPTRNPIKREKNMLLGDFYYKGREAPFYETKKRFLDTRYEQFKA